MHPALDTTRQIPTLSEQQGVAPDTTRQNPTLSEDQTVAAETLDPVRLQVIAALATGSSVSAAARRAGIHRGTIYDWMHNDPNFVAELNRSKNERAAELRSQVHNLGQEAFAALRAILSHDTIPAAVRLKAALSILDGMGALKPEAVGPTDPHQVSRSWLVAELKDEASQFL